MPITAATGNPTAAPATAISGPITTGAMVDEASVQPGPQAQRQAPLLLRRASLISVMSMGRLIP